MSLGEKPDTAVTPGPTCCLLSKQSCRIPSGDSGRETARKHPQTVCLLPTPALGLGLFLHSASPSASCHHPFSPRWNSLHPRPYPTAYLGRPRQGSVPPGFQASWAKGPPLLPSSSRPARPPWSLPQTKIVRTGSQLPSPGEGA